MHKPYNILVLPFGPKNTHWTELKQIHTIQVKHKHRHFKWRQMLNGKKKKNAQLWCWSVKPCFIIKNKAFSDCIWGALTHPPPLIKSVNPPIHSSIHPSFTTTNPSSPTQANLSPTIQRTPTSEQVTGIDSPLYTPNYTPTPASWFSTEKNCGVKWINPANQTNLLRNCYISVKSGLQPCPVPAENQTKIVLLSLQMCKLQYSFK